MKTALICGISGQDGAWLAKLLLEKGYIVFGTSRDAQASSFTNLKNMKLYDRIHLESMALNDFRSVLQVLTKVSPDEVYNLAGQSSVGLSFQLPVETLESIATGTLNLLEAIRFTKLPIKFYNAASSECYGDTGETRANEMTPFRPRSPYAVAKATAFWEVSNYREAYDIFACSGILFNHESNLRPNRFVTQKIVSTAVKIANGEDTKLELGNMDIWRDWGYAPEYVEAMWRMLQQDVPDDFVIATEETHSLMEFTEKVFDKLSLDWRENVIINETFFRPTDIKISRGDAEKARIKLGWKAETLFNDLIKILVNEEQNRISN